MKDIIKEQKKHEKEIKQMKNGDLLGLFEAVCIWKFKATVDESTDMPIELLKDRDLMRKEILKRMKSK